MRETAPGEAVWSALNAFEDKLRSDPDADLGWFLPPPGDPDRLPLLTELVRLDLECGWSRGRPRSPRDYFAQYPELRDDPTARAAVAFEDYRVRRLGGEAVTPECYAQEYGVDAAAWPVNPGAEDSAVPVTVVLRGPSQEVRLHDYAPTNLIAVASAAHDRGVVRDWLAASSVP